MMSLNLSFEFFFLQKVVATAEELREPGLNPGCGY
jgi:hypothetical protein